MGFSERAMFVKLSSKPTSLAYVITLNISKSDSHWSTFIVYREAASLYRHS